MAVEQPGLARRDLGEDRTWLAVMMTVTFVELTWWTLSWRAGIAPAPFVLTYLMLSFAGLGGAVVLRAFVDPRAPGPDWRSVVPATICVGIGASVFLPLKYAIPHLVPFWLDGTLAQLERAVFTADPWLLIDHVLGWAAAPMDRIYGLWLPTQAVVLFTVVLQSPGAAKSRALIAYILTWFLLGVVAATILSSAGPIFYDRAFDVTEFASLQETLRSRGAWLALAESDRMWTALASGRPGIVSGISAMPSIHVAISAWMIFAARALLPRSAGYAFVYGLVILVGSVQLGWHYVADGLAGVLGASAIWTLSRCIEARLSQGLADRSGRRKTQLA